MKVRQICLLGLVVAILFASCASKPKEPEISTDELNSLHSSVLALRQRANDLGLKGKADAEYTEAETHYLAGKTALDADKRPVAKTELTKSRDLYKALLAKYDTASKDDAETKRSDALIFKEAADEAKASVAVKDDYNKAQAKLDSAEAAYTAGRYSEAAIAFQESEKQFADAYNKTVQKRLTAQAELRSVESATASSAAKAVQGDKRLKNAGKE